MSTLIIDATEQASVEITAVTEAQLLIDSQAQPSIEIVGNELATIELTTSGVIQINDSDQSASYAYNTDGTLRQVTYADGSVLALTWVNGYLSRGDFTKNGVTTRTTYTYVDGVFTNKTVVTL